MGGWVFLCESGDTEPVAGIVECLSSRVCGQVVVVILDADIGDAAGLLIRSWSPLSVSFDEQCFE
jgi:hypothetical protein